jgi:diguanylate cyclase (GGDEF)-like protein
MSVKFFWFSDLLIKAKAATNANSLRLHLDNSKGHTRAAAASMAYNPEVVKALKNRDRDELLRVLAPVDDLYQVNCCTVTDEKGIVLARTHAPDDFGDSLAHLQTIKAALNGKILSSTETSPVIKVSVQTGAPVYDTDGSLLGVVATSVRFDTDEAVDELKELLHAEVTVFLGDTVLVTTVHRNEQRLVGKTLVPMVAKIVIDDKREYSGDVDILGQVYKAFYMPLLNANGDVFAVFFVGNTMAELRDESNALIRSGVVISFVVSVAAIFLLYWIISSISEPLIKLSQEMDTIEEGNLSVIITAQNDDEVGRAGQSLQKMVNTVHKLIDDISVAISEHEKGNMDYRFNTDAFHGDYRLLADRIVELSCIGLKDQLTGIPNRRTFNNRLYLEWNRALREKTPLSLLMIDVDQFKAYNDTYGHQQGDMALLTVAKTLAFAIRRAIDFAARWGGEEFVVLLPHTDSMGAMQIAESVRKEVENAAIPSVDGGKAKTVTISIGVHTQTPQRENSIEDLVSKADEALYQAKATGRNKVCKY